MSSVFETLNAVNVNEHTEKKNGLTYLSWAWAWGIVKKYYPNATYTIYENQLPNGYLVNYFTDGKTCWVKTGVTIEGIEHIEELPVMDFKNKSIPADAVTSFDVNKAIQRSLTKAAARHGIGLYIYAGEDLPEDAEKMENKANNEPSNASKVANVQPEERKMISKEQMMEFIKFPLETQKWFLAKIKVGSVADLTEEQWLWCNKIYTEKVLPNLKKENNNE